MAADGEAVFKARCASCHALMPDAPRGPGPHLAGVIGRPIGGDAGFAYSEVLQAARAEGLRWDGARLRAFLADPEEMFPGIWMGANGLRSAADRDAVAAFLAGGSAGADGKGDHPR